MKTKEIYCVFVDTEFIICESKELADWISTNDDDAFTEFGIINLKEEVEIENMIVTKEFYFFKKFISDFEFDQFYEEDDIKSYIKELFNKIPKFSVSNIDKKEFDVLLNNVNIAHLKTDSISQALIKVNKLNSNILKLFK